jgi:hypothetical protein
MIHPTVFVTITVNNNINNFLSNTTLLFEKVATCFGFLKNHLQTIK